MTRTGRKFGGILALVGGGLTTYAVFYVLGYTSIIAEAIITFAVTLILVILVIVGGILLFLDKKIGGILAIIAGTVIIVGLFIWIVPPNLTLTVNLGAIFVEMLGFNLYIDSILIIAGGIVGLAAGSEL